MYFAEIAFRNLMLRPVRTLLTGLGVALGVASFITFVGLSDGVRNAWMSGLEDRGTQVLAMRKGSVEILTGSIDESLGDRLLKHPSVKRVSGELIELITIKDKATLLLAGWNEESFLWQSLNIISGDLSEGVNRGEVVIGEGIAAVLKLSVGDSIPVLDRFFRIRAISRSRGVLNNNAIILPLLDMQALSGKQGRVTVFHLRLHDKEDISASLKSLHTKFPRLLFSASGEIGSNNQMLELLNAIAWSTSVIALSMCILIVINTLLISVTERKKEIGILSALGWRPQRIVRLVVIEAMIITLLGSISGAIIGSFGLLWISKSTMLAGYIQPELKMEIIPVTLVVAVMVGVLSSLYPGWKAATSNPVDALRYE